MINTTRGIRAKTKTCHTRFFRPRRCDQFGRSHPVLGSLAVISNSGVTQRGLRMRRKRNQKHVSLSPSPCLPILVPLASPPPPSLPSPCLPVSCLHKLLGTKSHLNADDSFCDFLGSTELSDGFYLDRVDNDPNLRSSGLLINMHFQVIRPHPPFLN